MPRPTSREIVDRLIRAIETADFDAIDELVADDVVEEYPQSAECMRGKSNRRAVYQNDPSAGLAFAQLNDRDAVPHLSVRIREDRKAQVVLRCAVRAGRLGCPVGRTEHRRDRARVQVSAPFRRGTVTTVLVAALVALAACTATAPPGSAPPAAAKDIAPGGSPGGLAFDFGSLWVGLADKGAVARIDPVTGTVTKEVTVGDPAKLLPQARVVHGVPNAVASGFGSIWAVGADGRLARIDPATNEATTFDVGVVGGALATGEGAVWITSYDDGAVVRFDPTARAVTKTITGLGGLFGVAVAFGSVWVVSKTGHQVLRLDPTSGTVTARIAAERSPDWVTVGAGSVWVTRETPAAILRIDPAANTVVATIPPDPSGGIGGGITFYDGAVWTGFLVRIDPSTEKVTASFAGNGEQRALALGGGSAWVADLLTVHQVPLALVR